MKLSVFEKAWSVVFDRFFCPETQLFYEFVIDDQNNAWHHLPSAEEIRASVPNPCGWGTGMEDSALNGGTALDALVAAYELTKDARIKPCVDSIFDGLMRCASDQSALGFIARSVSPTDGKTHYIESSRDQYTHWIYGALRLYDSPLCDREQKTRIRAVLEAIAEKCLRDVTEQNGYHMTRADGSIGMAGKMWGAVGTHEALRLPMFYLAAFHVTGKSIYQKTYEKYIADGLNLSLAHRPETMRCYCSLQMQCSLKTVYDYDINREVRRAALDMMIKNAAYGEKKAVQNSAELCKPEHRESICYRFRRWNEVEPRHMGQFGGFEYNNPAQSERKDNPTFYPVREVAEGAIMAAMSPDFPVSEALCTAVQNMAEHLDLARHSSVYAPLLLCCAHILCRKNFPSQKSYRTTYTGEK